MKYFLGAKDKNNIAFIAEMINAENFEAAFSWLDQKAKAEKGEGNYRITAVNEYPVITDGALEVLDITTSQQKPPAGFPNRDAGFPRPTSQPPAVESAPCGPRWSMLRIVELPKPPDSEEDDIDVDLQIAHSTKFESAEQAKESPAARLISIAYRFIDAVLQGTITEETRVLDFYRADGRLEAANQPLIILPDSPELESSSREE